MKLERQLDVVDYIRITIPKSIDMGDLAGSKSEKLKARNSVRGHLVCWHDKQAMNEYLKEFITDSNLRRKEP